MYGVVVDGKLARVRAFGVRDVATGAPVTPDTAFRIASMSKQFTALATLRLRDAGRVSLDAPAEKYIPEMRKWHYPTSDSPRITVRDLLSHAAGFVTDDPWGDRQLDMSEADFTRFVAAGVPFSRAPGMAYEYSNFGFALVGRVVTNTARTNYAEYITENFFRPLGMQHTVWDIGSVPAAQRAHRLSLGKRGVGARNRRWARAPLAPWADSSPRPMTMRATSPGCSPPGRRATAPRTEYCGAPACARSRDRQTTSPCSPPTEPSGCARGASYGYGMIPFSDCVLGFHFGHSGGLPGYGSNVLFLPERGVAVFAFTNRTYARVSLAVREAANTLVQSGAFPARNTPLSPALGDIARAVERMYEAGDVLAARERLAANVLLDQGVEPRNARIAELRKKLGVCQPRG